MHNGDFKYLEEQKKYLIALLNQLADLISEDGRSTTPEWRFIDWSSSENELAVDAGIHSMLIMAMEAGEKLCNELGEYNDSKMCFEAVAKLRRYIPNHNGSKQAASLMALAGLVDVASINRDVLAVDGAKRISTFLGFYVLKARAMDGDITGSLNCIREYWGGMLKLGATTFWEDFNLDWMENAARIDEIVMNDKKDVHGDYGDYCYKGYRHSLCHGWASGPTAWLSEYILGVKIIMPGCKVVEINPSLGDLKWAEGTFPTPEGIIHVRHERQLDGSILSTIEAPVGITITRGNCNDSKSR